MTRPLLIWTLFFALLPALSAAQEPAPEPIEETQQQEPEPQPPAEESPTDESSPADETDAQEPAPDEPQEPDTPAEPTEDATPTEGEPTDDAEEPERVLTPEEEEIRRKAAEKAAAREARSERRAEKKAKEEAKRAEKAALQELKQGERAAELVELGHASIDAEKYKDAQGHFEKARELEGGTSFEAEMGLAHLQLALDNYAQAVQLAQRAVRATSDRALKAEALTFAGSATLAARPGIDDDPTRPQPGSEMFLDAALRFFLRAVELDPFTAKEALAHLERRFPGGKPDARTTRLLAQYFEHDEAARIEHGRRVAATYEALLSGRAEPGGPIAVVGPVTPPKRLSGKRPHLIAEEGAPPRRRLAAAFVIQPDGTVTEAEILDEVTPEQGGALVETLLEWTFEPARLPNGTAVTVYWLQGVSVSPQ